MRAIPTEATRFLALAIDFLFGHGWRGIRLLLAGALLAALLAASIGDTVRVCSEESAITTTESTLVEKSSSTQPDSATEPSAATETSTTQKRSHPTVVELCQPVRPTDAAFAALMLLALLLIAPEINEFTAFGISVKRRVAEAKQAADEAKEEARLVEVRLHQQIQNLQATATATSSPQFFFGSAKEMERMAQRVSSARLRDGDERPPAPSDTQPPSARPSLGEAHEADADLARGRALRHSSQGDAQPGRSPFGQAESTVGRATPEEAQLAQQLIALWEDIVRMSGLGQESGLVPPSVARRFLSVYRREIEALRAARNSVAHAQPIDLAALESSVHLAERLLSLLREAPER